MSSTVHVSFTIPASEYRALERIATARAVSLPVLYRQLGRRLTAGQPIEADPLPVVVVHHAPAVKPRTRRRTGTRTHLTAANIRQLTALHLAGISASQIAPTIPCHQNTVRRFIDGLGLPHHPRGPQLGHPESAQRIAEVLARLEAEDMEGADHAGDHGTAADHLDVAGAAGR